MSDELTARLAAGMACSIDPPDYQTRLGILRHLATKIGFDLADDVAEFIATHLTSHARELSGALESARRCQPHLAAADHASAGRGRAGRE